MFRLSSNRSWLFGPRFPVSWLADRKNDRRRNSNQPESYLLYSSTEGHLYLLAIARHRFKFRQVFVAPLGGVVAGRIMLSLRNPISACSASRDVVLPFGHVNHVGTEVADGFAHLFPGSWPSPWCKMFRLEQGNQYIDCEISRVFREC